jgi:predicted Zn finger-like uncharacterized protein
MTRARGAPVQSVPDQVGMIIVCPQCESRYHIAEARLPEAGRTVRCTRCRAKWLAFPEAQGDEGGPGADAGAEADADVMTMPAEEAEIEVETVEPWPEEAAPEPAPAESVEEVAARAASAPLRKPPRAKRRPLRLLPRRRHLALVASVAALAALGIYRNEIVRAAPGAASLYEHIGLHVNLRGLAFDGVRTSEAIEEGTTVLSIEGNLSNITPEAAAVPRLRLAIRDDRNVELYSWTAVLGRTQLKPGESLAFKTRLAAPPSEGRSVAVRFLRPEDMLAAAK